MRSAECAPCNLPAPTRKKAPAVARKVLDVAPLVSQKPRHRAHSRRTIDRTGRAVEILAHTVHYANGIAQYKRRDGRVEKSQPRDCSAVCNDARCSASVADACSRSHQRTLRPCSLRRNVRRRPVQHARTPDATLCSMPHTFICTLLLLSVALPVPAGAVEHDSRLLGRSATAPLVAPSQDTSLTVAPTSDSAQPDSTTPEPVSNERGEQDARIRSELQGVFDRVPALSRVDVSVDAGVVRLEGTVLDVRARERAVELAESMDDVVFVDNRVRSSTSLDEQLQPTWARLRELGYGAVAKLPLLLVAILIIGFAGTLGTLLARWSGPSFLRTRNPFLQNLVRRLLQSAIVLIGVVVAVDLLDATALAGALVGTAGLAGLAVGFAFKDIVENYLAGTILAFRQPFAKNDEIRVDSFHGKVVRLTPRETILMTLDGNHVRLPNALIFRSPLTNFTRNPMRQFQFDAGLGVQDDLVHARVVAVEALRAMDGVLEEPPPQALVMDLGASSVTMRFLAWTDQRVSETVRVRSEAIRIVKQALENAGLTMPSPEYVLHMETPAQRVVDAPRTVTPTQGQADVSVDRTVDLQIDADRRVSDEEDLLDESASDKHTAP